LNQYLSLNQALDIDTGKMDLVRRDLTFLNNFLDLSDTDLALKVS